MSLMRRKYLKNYFRNFKINQIKDQGSDILKLTASF